MILNFLLNNKSFILDNTPDFISIQFFCPQLVFGYSHASLSEARVMAGRRAALEARQRAESMAEAVGGKLGPCLALREDSCSHKGPTCSQIKIFFQL